ncbi:tyrosine-type recombinase/integrase [Andreprevotia chitinilytica]|uniref:tyrosine-type recombinase/integrase n=1 Tax=Andreprevotia chitinilytica TaxID=396808 RepID=UPI00054E6C93|nr:tyrosine-type recombinase/integrase [Andreprevotia chitinilytica]
MARKRNDNPLGLPLNVYAKHSAFYYVHRSGKWERLGTDVREAKRKAQLYNDPDNTFGTMTYFLDAFVVHCAQRTLLPREKGGMAPRTYEDYKRDIEPLKAYFGRMLPAAVEAKHIGAYLDMCVELDRPVRGNREKACLSACFSWMIRKGEGGINGNPCKGVRRNKETKRERYVEHAEYHAVRAVAVRQVQCLMALIYRTLQRPEDIIIWTAANLITKVEPDGSRRRIIRTKQGKTGATIDIAITAEIDEILVELGVTATPSRHQMTLIHTGKGEPYTYSGLCSMLTRYLKKSKVTNFGFYDLKGKGATDMWLSGIPLEVIQVLCGHESVKTTEIYVKSRWRGTVEPNKVDVNCSGF